MSQEWTERFFSGLWIEFQQSIWPADKSRMEVDFLKKIMKLPARASVLDVPCGDGRLSLEFAKRGHEVEGVDNSSQLLEAARANAQKSKLDITFTQSDMARMDYGSKFDAAVCVWGSLGYRTEREDMEFLECVRKALVPGGAFVLEVITTESLFKNFQETGWRQAGDILALEKRAWKPETSRIDCEWLLIKGEKRETKYSSIRVYTYREIVAMLWETGFEGIKSFNAQGEESKSASEISLNFRARRPGI